MQTNPEIDRRTMLRLSACATMGWLVNPGSYQNLDDTSSFDVTIAKRVIPSTGEKIPVVGLGTWRTFDKGQSEAERTPLREVMNNLVKGGGMTVDSSPMYGASEGMVGDLSAGLGIRSSLFLATKVWTHGKEAGIEQMNESFRKMRTAVMDLMQVHNLVDVQTHIKTLKDWKAEKKIRYFGITHYLPSAYPEIMKLISKEKPDFAQFNYNIADREAEDRLLPFAQDKGIAVIINRPFREGELFNYIEGKKLPEWVLALDIKNWAQFFLKFILSHPAVTCAIPATSKPLHLVENLGAGIGKLPDPKTRQKMVQYFRDL